MTEPTIQATELTPDHDDNARVMIFVMRVPASETSETVDPALRAHTFMDNDVLRASLQRLARRYWQTPLGVMEVAAADVTDLFNTIQIENALANAARREQEREASASDLDPLTSTLPSETDVCLQFLRVRGWQQVVSGDLNYAKFIDPSNSEVVDFVTACDRQNAREIGHQFAEMESWERAEAIERERIRRKREGEVSTSTSAAE